MGALVIVEGSFRVALDIDRVDARYAATGHAAANLPVDSEPTGGPRRVVVDLRRHVSGNPQRALVGAMFSPRATGRLTASVDLSDWTHRGGQVPASRITGDLWAGLPSECSTHVLAGLLSHAPGAGEVVVDRGGYHDVESSPIAFLAASQILGLSLRSDNIQAAVDPIRRMLQWEQRR